MRIIRPAWQHHKLPRRLPKAYHETRDVEGIVTYGVDLSCGHTVERYHPFTAKTVGCEPCYFEMYLNPVPKDPDRLTRREREVIVCLARGYSNKQIGKEMSIEAVTVARYLDSIFGKLSARNRTAAVVQALKRGYISLDEAA